MNSTNIDSSLQKLIELSKKEYKISVEEVRELISLITNLTRSLLITAGFPERSITQLTTKLRDAGRRSAPWRVFSQKLPGRPQDGADGNRIKRWLLPPEHKFYADEITATLVEVKYYLQVLSMNNAPKLPPNTIQDKFLWLTAHQIIPGAYLDPIQLIPIDLKIILQNLREIHSGHFIPLDREGKHEPKNTFLVWGRSNQLQGNLTVPELLKLMKEIVEKHGAVDESKTS